MAARQLSSTARKAVITVPAHFNEDQKLATKKAAELAGLEEVILIDEPTAAALACRLHDEMKQGEQ